MKPPKTSAIRTFYMAGSVQPLYTCLLVDGKILLVCRREISSRPAISSLNNLKMRNSSVCN
ncbi:MAG TPA: hypothetical protein PLM96_06670 [Methanoregulaceae archaeon]|jgi:hypothetical protein|nr:hypothetical protein [Methanoregulaceae archaeon]HPJ74556.1 hypothetical protein [Methanoregulaceae archaeon]HPQ76308.1 hypothetical protein [Methanoregulaceae archaeon]HRX34669.1 hypothetical protein [Methanoregulaceae archaeon]